MITLDEVAGLRPVLHHRLRHHPVLVDLAGEPVITKMRTVCPTPRWAVWGRWAGRGWARDHAMRTKRYAKQLMMMSMSAIVVRGLTKQNRNTGSPW